MKALRIAGYAVALALLAWGAWGLMQLGGGAFR